METIIRTHELSKTYNRINAVDDFNLEIKKGHIYGIVGPNGAGKTTFFKMLAGLVTPTNGYIEICNGNTLEKYRKKMSFMIENPYLYKDMTAIDNMKIIGGIKGENDEKKLEKLLELVGLGQTKNKKVKQFSLGMKQRLGIACALTSNPEILILDEPMNGLDPEGIVALRKMLISLSEELHITLLVSSHILGELYNLSTDFIFIARGKIINQLNKKDFEKNKNGCIKLNTTNNNEVVKMLKDYVGERKVELKEGIIYITESVGMLETISKEITDKGFTLTMLVVELMDLERYYMEEIVEHE